MTLPHVLSEGEETIRQTQTDPNLRHVLSRLGLLGMQGAGNQSPHRAPAGFSTCRHGDAGGAEATTLRSGHFAIHRSYHVSSSLALPWLAVLHPQQLELVGSVSESGGQGRAM